MKRFPLITAHTGCMGQGEHSLESLEAALKLGVDVYEDDIRVTRDRVPVFAHDDKILLPGNQSASLAALTLQELNAALTIPILQLEDVLNRIRNAGRVMNLDIKTDDALEPTAALVKRLGMDEQVFLSGCHLQRAERAKRSGIVLRKLLNVDPDSLRYSSYEEAARQACADANRTGCFGLNVPYQAVKPELLDTAQAAGLRVYVWTVAEAEEMRRLAGWGVDSITTRDPAKLIAIREEWFAENNSRG
ncbi:glycerophosphodiester phosphodiesterase [Saccharibacillus sacchari]|uniref:Glycerophosphodiester phosphodiesterase n=1 Tax=Saccharibacillus sacchari TaxID=456493 RepID=A0ACC6PJC6_9BACL